MLWGENKRQGIKIVGMEHGDKRKRENPKKWYA